MYNLTLLMIESRAVMSFLDTQSSALYNFITL